MKPLYLEFCGINSFSEKATIDFEKLLSGGIFGIFGDTGSGKSTILDAIHFALYGQIERANGNATASINDKSEKATVLFRFELSTGGKRARYGVERERRRKNGVVKAKLYEYAEGGETLVLAEGAKEVDKRVVEILGLTFEEFKKCIALPQGEFDSLVKAKRGEQLALVSRIFDLERYGDGVYGAIKKKFEECKTEIETILARMEENMPPEGEDEKTLSEKLAEKRAVLRETEKEIEKVEEKAREEEKKISAKKEHEALCRKWESAQVKLPEYEKKRTALQRLPEAKRVAEAAKEKREAEREFEQAKVSRERAETEEKQALLKLDIATRALEESGTAKKWEEKSRLLALLESKQSEIQARDEAKRALEKSKLDYKKIANLYEREDFDKLLAEAAEKKAALGADVSFTEFMRSLWKDEILSETYLQFQKELSFLAEKYPTAKEDIRALLAKYEVRGESKNSPDLKDAKAQYDAMERERKKWKEEEEKILARKRSYEDNEAEKARICKDGEAQREAYNRANEKLKEFEKEGTISEVRAETQKLKAQSEKEIAEKQEAEKTLAEKAATLVGKREAEKASENRLQKAEEKRLCVLKESGFSSETEANELLDCFADEEKTRKQTEEYFTELNALKGRKEETDTSFFATANEEALLAAREEKRLQNEKKAILVGEIAVAEKNIERYKLLRQKYEEFKEKYEKKNGEKENWEKLLSLVKNKALMEFIATEYLQDVCKSANRMLLSLTRGRYYLQYDGEFKAADNYNGGVLRNVKTLSGGEIFLASLSLALALSDTVCAKSLRPIEFFFLDEGFGTLDEKLVDVVMDGLNSLKRERFSIGLISHVEELKHRIENKILVTGATESHGSTIKTEAIV